jgi:hypothetical protein
VSCAFTLWEPNNTVTLAEDNDRGATPTEREVSSNSAPLFSEKRRHNASGEVMGDHPSTAGWSWGCVSAIDSNGRTIWIADAHRDDGKRFVVRASELLTAFLELESAIRASSG